MLIGIQQYEIHIQKSKYEIQTLERTEIKVRGLDNTYSFRWMHTWGTIREYDDLE